MSSAAGLRLERLATHHDLSRFDSGNDEVDGWLRRHALVAQQMDSARTFVLTYQDRVVGFFSLTMGSVLRQDAPPRLVSGLPAYPVGMVLLERLAVARGDKAEGSAARCSPKRSARRSPPARPRQPVSSSWTRSTRAPRGSMSGTGSSLRLDIACGSTAA